MPIISTFPTGSGGGEGGGIPLAPVTGLATLAASGKAYIKWTDPVDTVVGDATLAAWSGTLLIRKANSMPANRRDGTVVLDNKVRDAYKNTYFCDSGLSDGVTYYYKLFPYSTTNTYTDDVANEVTITPNPVPTDNVTGITLVAQLNGRVQLKWTDPAATKVTDGITLATWASTKVVYKTGSYPTTPEDGTLALNSTTRNAYASSPLEVTGLTNGTTYYFALFPISTEGAVNTNTANAITATPNKISLTTVPAQINVPTYDGTSKTPSWNSAYDNTKMRVEVTAQIQAGTNYKAKFYPLDDYKWSDDSAYKEVNWTINKAAGGINSLSKTSITLNSSTKTDSFTVDRKGDGAITAESSDTSVATCSVSGTTVTVNSVNDTTGTANITVKVNEGTNHTAFTTGSICTVDAQFLPAKKELNLMTWDEIKQISDAGIADTYWAVGDKKEVVLNGTIGTLSLSNVSIYAFIIGFNHNSGKEGSNRIHFQFGKTSAGADICLCDSNYNGSKSDGTKTFNINHWGGSSSPYNTNYGGWAACDMRYDILGSTDQAPSPYGSTKTTSATGQNPSASCLTNPVANTWMAALPSALRSVLKSVTKYQDNTGGGSDTASYVTATIEYLFLLSEWEVQGARTYANSAEKNYQEQYAYYSAGNSKVKNKHNATTTAVLWWLRSVASSYTGTFCPVNTDGSANATDSRASYGVAPAFCV